MSPLSKTRENRDFVELKQIVLSKSKTNIDTTKISPGETGQ